MTADGLTNNYTRFVKKMDTFKNCVFCKGLVIWFL